jgi:hypothetical protein
MATSEQQVIGTAWAHVAEGFRRALEVPGLPVEEVDDLRVSPRTLGH